MTAAALAPAGSFCAVHTTVAAATICTRCGTFMCGECSGNNQQHMCPKCLAATGFDVHSLARAYRNLVLWFGVQLMIELANMAVHGGRFIGLMILGSTVPLTIYAYKTAKALGSTLAILWALAMFMPCINVVTLLTLSSRATSACRERNIAVGFFGPKI